MTTEVEVHVNVSVENEVATIKLNRPEKMNAIGALTRKQLGEAIKQVERDDAIRVVVLTGAGRAFCSGADVTELFNLLTGYSRQHRYRKLLVAPTSLRAGITQLIEREGKPGGRIIIKVNNLIDPEIIEALYTASQGGAKIDLIIRGMCSLRPGVAGLSERIKVRSIVGRFLEHSRVFVFGDGGDSEYYLGSSDLMPRNLDRRVEAVVPVSDPKLRQRLSQILEIVLADDVLAWELCPDGAWQRVPTVRGLNSHKRFQELALESARGNGVVNGVAHA